MKFSSDFKLVGNLVTLIPYKSCHVEKYHGWMEDPEILRLTGSERLTLEQEYQMQQEWERDEQKCTFIIMDNEKINNCKSELPSIVGDTNLFFQDDPMEAEIEVMIAENWARRRGLAKEALEMMIRYGCDELNKTKFIAKIKEDNMASLALFERIGFIKVSESKVFQEYTYELRVQQKTER